MKPKKVRPFWVVGLRARTDGRTEQDPELAQAPRLWFRLLDKGLMFQIPSRVNRIEYLTLFTDYESDALGAFTVVAGQRVAAVDWVPEGLEALCFHGGEYLVFHARGEHPEAVDRGHEEVDRFFKSTTEYARLWTTDFEVSGKTLDQTDIYIAVRKTAGAS